jgi:hypothetical protein
MDQKINTMKKLVLMLALASATAIAQQARADVVLDVNAPGCVAKDSAGKPVVFAGKPGDIIRVPRGTSFNDACLVDLSLSKTCLYKGSNKRPVITLANRGIQRYAAIAN